MVSAIRVPHGKDPADAVLGGYAEAFREALGRGVSEVTFRFQSVLTKHNAGDLEGKKAILQELLPALKPKGVFDPVASEMRRLVIDTLKIDGPRLDEWVNAKTKRTLDTTQLRGMQRQGSGGSQVAVIELELIALLLLEPAKLEARLPTVTAALPSEGDDSLLREFTDICHACRFDDGAILRRYRERDEGRVLFERLLTPQTDEHHIDIDAHLGKSLSRLRELYLSGEKEGQRKLLLERMHEVSSFLTDPNLPTDKLKHYYAELKEINAMLAARDAERRTRVPTGYANRKRR